MTLRTKAIKGAKWTVIQEILSQLIDFVILIILARLLLPKEFGIIAVAGAIITAIGPVVSLGLGVAILQKDEIDRKHLDTAFWSVFIMGCLFSGFFVISSSWWADFFTDPALDEVLSWLSINIILSSLVVVQEAILRRNLNFKVFAIRTSIGKLIGGIAGITLAFYGFGIWSLVVRYLTTPFVGLLLLWKVSEWRPTFFFSRKHFKELFSFGIHVSINELLILINRQSDTFLISFFLGSTALGYYNTAYRLMSLVFRLVSKTVSQVGMPTFSRIQHDKAKIKQGFYDITQLVSIIAFPIFLGMLIIVPEALVTLFGEKWAPSIPVLQILLLVGIVQCLLSPFIAVIMGSGRAKLRLKLQVTDSILNLFGFFIAVQWGIIWVATSYVTVNYLLLPLWCWGINKIIKIKWSTYLKLILRPLILTLIMLSMIICIKLNIINLVDNIHYIAISITSGILIYVIMVFCFYQSATKKIISITKTAFSKR